MAIKPNYYETLYVVRPDLKEEELSKIQSKLPEFIDAHEGEIIKAEKWAERELAYEIQDHKRGTYYILVFKALPAVTKDIERHLRFYNTDVLRFMTVRIEEEDALREKNLQEEAKAPEATPAAPATEQTSAPAENTATQSAEPANTQQPATESTPSTPTQEPGGNE